MICYVSSCFCRLTICCESLGLSVHVRTEFWDSYTWKVFCLSAPELLCGEQATSLNVINFICTWHLDGDLEKSLDGSVAVWSGAYCSLLSAAVESRHEQLWDSLHLDNQTTRSRCWWYLFNAIFYIQKTNTCPICYTTHISMYASFFQIDPDRSR